MVRLRELRVAKKLTQKEMAVYLGIDRTTYVKYETGGSEPNFDTLIRIANYFEVTTDYLLECTPEKVRNRGGICPFSARIVKIAEHFKNLTDEEQDMVIAYAQELSDPELLQEVAANLI